MAGTEVTSRGVFVGVDSGGTRTNVLVVADDGATAGVRSASYEVGESLSGALASKFIGPVLSKIFAPLDARIENLSAGDLPCFAWISAAGFSPWTRDQYVYALEEMSTTLASLGIKSVGVANDAVSLLLGSEADGIVIAGTGSSTSFARRTARSTRLAVATGWRATTGAASGSGCTRFVRPIVTLRPAKTQYCCSGFVTSTAFALTRTVDSSRKCAI